MVSIVVPVYNIKEYLPACVKSLLGQSCADLEIILVDDGSTDGSAQLCDMYAAKDPRVVVIHKENGGLSSARNAGLDIARGAWLLFVDGDDYLCENAVQLLLEAVKGHEDADFIQFLYRETDGTWQPEWQNTERQICTRVPEFFGRLYDRGGVAASSCTKLFRRTVFDRLRFREGLHHEDEELMTRLLPTCHKVVYTQLVLYGYVTRQGSIVRSGFSPKSMDVFVVLEERVRALETLGFGDLAKETRRRIFQTAAWQYCLARKNGYKDEACSLKQLLQNMSKDKDLHLTGWHWALCQMTKAFPFAPEMHYLLRRIVRKI